MMGLGIPYTVRSGITLHYNRVLTPKALVFAFSRNRKEEVHSHRTGTSLVRCNASSNNEDDIELAVFRFTLGIPGFDDALIPRVAGSIGGLALLLNHVLSGDQVSLSQSVTEVVGFLLAGVAIVAPDIQKRIEESTPGKGRRPPMEHVEGSTNVFAISDSLSEAQRQEAAWASFAIMKNANVCGVYLCIRDESILCRGLLGLDSSGSQSLEKASQEMSRLDAENTFVYLDTKGAINSSAYNECRLVPSGAGGIANFPIVPLDGKGKQSSGRMILICDRERAMSTKELAWCRSVASTLYHAFES